ncbi:MAG: cupin domain-containing protein [Fimbriiglobus sp.]|jgi:mannose-6-phosphate isomerase-like protein (cupin superfamily)|nr:cupin domain-containing protein [Fimbriiglobus sp.]
MSGFVVRHRSDAPTVPCPCGFSTRILTAADGGPCSVHVTKIRDSVRHYHAETTEVYFVLEGTGRMELNGEWHEVRPGSVVRIDAGTRHRLIADDEVTTVVMAMPAFNPADEHFD